MPAGYSGTPLVRKLGLKPAMRARVINEPDHYGDLLGEIPEDITFVKSTRGSFDFIHCFVRTRNQLARALPKLRENLEADGTLWMSWPKKSSPLAGEIAESDIRTAGLDAGLVDVKICAVDEDWSGLKFVFRKVDRPKRTR